MKRVFPIGQPDAGRRIERFLQRALGDVPSSLVQKLLRKGDVRRNGRRARAGELLESGDEVVVHHRATTQRQDAPIATSTYSGPAVEIVARDADYVALNKPAGARCSVDDAPEKSLQSWVAGALAAEIATGSARPELCHRLDAGTTGLVLVALNAASFTAFHRALENGRLRKVYHVLVLGRPEFVEWIEETPLRRLGHAPRGRPKVVAAPGGGETAATRLRWLASSGDVSLLEAEPITGRTHQIRAHLYALGLPVLGDPRYGDARRERRLGLERSFDHQLLHAHRLELPGPPPRIFRAPHPPEFVMALRKLSLGLEALGEEL